MDTATISRKYQVVIPQRIRKAMRLAPGQKMQVIQHGNRIELIPEQDIQELRGFLKGISTAFEREDTPHPSSPGQTTAPPPGFRPSAARQGAVEQAA